MKFLAVAICAGVMALTACGGDKQKAKAKADLDRYFNTDMKQAHEYLHYGHKAYQQIAAKDIDEPGKLEHLKFNLVEVAEPFLRQGVALAEKVTPPEAAKLYHSNTLSVFKAEHTIIAKLAAALSPVDADAFKRAHDEMMSHQSSVFKWEEDVKELQFEYDFKLTPLDKPKLPEAGSGATVPAPP